MSDLLTTILFGTFVPPDVPSRKFLMDDRAHRVTTNIPKTSGVSSRAAIINSLKRNPFEWMSIAMVSAHAGCCNETAGKVMNKLASERIVLKRFSGTGKRGGKAAVFKWINKNAQK